MEILNQVDVEEQMGRNGGVQEMLCNDTCTEAALVQESLWNYKLRSTIAISLALFHLQNSQQNPLLINLDHQDPILSFQCFFQNLISRAFLFKQWPQLDLTKIPGYIKVHGLDAQRTKCFYSKQGFAGDDASKREFDLNERQMPRQFIDAWSTARDNRTGTNKSSFDDSGKLSPSTLSLSMSAIKLDDTSFMDDFGTWWTIRRSLTVKNNYFTSGNQVTNVSFFGLAQGNARGVVPSARIAVYKVCWEEGCDAQDILSAFDDAISDGVDIHSVSLGGEKSDDYSIDPIAIGAFHAMQNGILTSQSAGNNGPEPGSISSIVPWILSVVASNTDRKIIDKVILGDNTTLMAGRMENRSWGSGWQ
ncbi:hypothetical protein IFM89_029308 [Coptis chinensis]|uniref:Peptidase S8/S53 domain-containing protein n=1 Tax=Coptis chinensis TaxID=261450 RepID=A0A835IR35_9MAGN|nr:hypothetical protein IFM89_029308 [Coptis chinensis]